jgi:hypothetical protein
MHTAFLTVRGLPQVFWLIVWGALLLSASMHAQAAAASRGHQSLFCEADEKRLSFATHTPDSLLTARLFPRKITAVANAREVQASAASSKK